MSNFKWTKAKCDHAFKRILLLFIETENQIVIYMHQEKICFLWYIKMTSVIRNYIRKPQSYCGYYYWNHNTFRPKLKITFVKSTFYLNTRLSSYFLCLLKTFFKSYAIPNLTESYWEARKSVNSPVILSSDLFFGPESI